MADSTINNTGALIAPDGTEMTAVETVGGVTGHSSLQSIADLGGGIVTIVADDEDVTLPARSGTTVVLYSALTAQRNVFLPPATSPPMIVEVVDLTRSASDANNINVQATGGDIGGFSIDATYIAHYVSVSVTNNGIDGWFPLQDATPSLVDLANSLGGQDGDGNVYSIQFDALNETLTMQCVQPDRTINSVAVSPGQLLQRIVSPDGSSSGILVQSNTVFAQVSGADGSGSDFHAETGLATLSVSDGVSVFHSVAASLAGVTIDNVVVDPTQPWPGG